MAIDLSRRAFFGSMGLGMAGLAMAGYAPVVSAYADEEKAAEATAPVAGDFDNEWSGPGSATGDWTGTPENLKAIGLSTMPLDELNRRRQLYVDAQTERVCEDGTVIPEVYVKFRALLNTYGHGVGVPLDTSFVAVMTEVTEDEAQAYLEMPRGRQFNLLEFSAESGRPLEECEAHCESLYQKGWISRTENSKGVLYGQIAFLYGIEENHTPQFHADPVYAGAFTGTYGEDGMAIAYSQSGTPFFITTPVSKDAVKDGAIDPLDDMLALLDTKNKFCVSPCPCRTLNLMGDKGPVHIEGYPGGDYDIKDVRTDQCGHYLETCLVLGEEAEFWIDLGVGRELTRDEAKALLQRSIDDGMILQRIPTKEAENICSCHGDCCGIISCWEMMNTSESRTFKQISRYTLEVDTDACIGCGTCVDRCPMAAVGIEEGKATLVGSCFKCGQCALSCPADARILVPKPEDERMPIFEDIYDMNNRMAAERFESGLVR